MVYIENPNHWIILKIFLLEITSRAAIFSLIIIAALNIWERVGSKNKDFSEDFDKG